MGVYNLDRIFNPGGIAVIGASEKAGSVGSTLMINLIQSGLEKDLFPVNPRRKTIHGLKSLPSILNAEGRCLPECLSLVADQKDILPADICPPKHLCAPCYDLFTGLSTGVCELPGDSGPTRPPVVFEACCDAAGVCLPGEMVPTDHRNLLGAGTCSNAADFFCVPNVLMEDEFSPKVCRSIADLEGRCLPECLPMIEARSSFLPSDVCEADFRCAPCYDPFDGHDTGACALPNDPGPLEAPVVFNKCCESSGIQIGTCMPSDSLPPNMTDQLISDSCTKPDYLCVPDNIISIPGATGFPSCTSSSGETGGCVPACYLSWEEALVFPRADCGQGEHCVECVWAGQSTGVCS